MAAEAEQIGGAAPTSRLPPAPRPGDELDLTVDSLAFGGAGVARSDGYVVFVSGAVPGDRVERGSASASGLTPRPRRSRSLSPAPTA